MYLLATKMPSAKEIGILSMVSLLEKITWGLHIYLKMFHERNSETYGCHKGM
jgi:hypothetical protein